MRLLSLSEASIPPRTSPLEFADCHGEVCAGQGSRDLLGVGRHVGGLHEGVRVGEDREQRDQDFRAEALDVLFGLNFFRDAIKRSLRKRKKRSPTVLLNKKMPVRTSEGTAASLHNLCEEA